MSRRVALMSVSLCILLVLGVWGQAQEIVPRTAPDDDAAIAIRFPPPVFVLSGTVDIIGTADALLLTDYVIEYRALTLSDETGAATDETADEVPWFPATFVNVLAVRDDVLGTWDTTRVEDGLYEIRLVVNVDDQDAPMFFRVSPLRVLNDTADSDSASARPTLPPTPTQIGGFPVVRTLEPNPDGTPIVDPAGGPQVVANINSNVRLGDSTVYPRVGVLFRDTAAQLLGISTTGSGWFFVELETGARGFIAPELVQIFGEIGDLPQVEPPPVPATFTPSHTPTPVATEVPPTTANLRITGMSLEPNPPVCGEPFRVLINVSNVGSGPTLFGGTVSIVDVHGASGTVTSSTNVGISVIQPGQSEVINGTLTVNTFFAEGHTVQAIIDPGNGIPETNEGDNSFSVSYTLATGGC